MSSYTSLLCCCLLGLMTIIIGSTAAENSQGHGDDLKKRVEELETAIKLADASLEKVGAQVLELHQKAKEGMAEIYSRFQKDLLNNYLSKLPAYEYYVKHSDCLPIEQQINLDVIGSDVVKSAKSCVYKQTALDVLDQIQSLGNKITAILRQNSTALEEKCLKKDSPEEILHCLSAILLERRTLAAQEQNFIPLWKLALADYLKDDSTLDKTCYNLIVAQFKAKIEAILNKYCQPPKNK